jgi:hypothetical protein
MTRSILIRTWLLAAACVPAPAFAALEAKLDGQVGGVFSNACSDRSQIMIRLYGDVLDVERGSVAVKANKLKSSTQPPPGPAIPDFKAVVRGEVKGGDGIVLVLTHNAKGLFARIDGGEKSLAPLGAGVIGMTVRHCDPNRNALPGAPPPPSLPSPPMLLKDARFKAAYNQALGPLAREPWLMKLDGPAPESRLVKVAGTDYLLASVCKPHDCSDHNLVLLWQAQQGQLLGMLQQRGRKTLLGAPAPAAASEIDRLWTSEWRK